MAQRKHKHVAPQHSVQAFNCPHCGAYAEQYWANLQNNNYDEPIEGFEYSLCNQCVKAAIWVDKKLVWPVSGAVEPPHEQMPDDVAAVYEEAAQIAATSPRAAAALLRLAVEKLVIPMAGGATGLNDAIGHLVKNGLPSDVQKMLDSLRVIGNNAVHSLEIDLKDDENVTMALFGILNLVVERMIAIPKDLESIHALVPPTAQEQIKRRDKKN